MTEELEKYLVERIKWLECHLAETESSLVQNGCSNYDIGYERGKQDGYELGLKERLSVDYTDYKVMIEFLVKNYGLEITCMNNNIAVRVGKEKVAVDNELVARSITRVMNDL